MPFVEKTIFFSIVLPLLFVKDQLTIFMWVYFWGGSVFTAYCVILLSFESCENNSYIKQIKMKRKTRPVPFLPQEWTSNACFIISV
jgi:hypothetical protein